MSDSIEIQNPQISDTITFGRETFIITSLTDHSDRLPFHRYTMELRKPNGKKLYWGNIWKNGTVYRSDIHVYR